MTKNNICLIPTHRMRLGNPLNIAPKYCMIGKKIKMCEVDQIQDATCTSWEVFKAYAEANALAKYQ
jgi:hypothetical protein